MLHAGVVLAWGWWRLGLLCSPKTCTPPPPVSRGWAAPGKHHHTQLICVFWSRNLFIFVRGQWWYLPGSLDYLGRNHWGSEGKWDSDRGGGQSRISMQPTAMLVTMLSGRPSLWRRVCVMRSLGKRVTVRHGRRLRWHITSTIRNWDAISFKETRKCQSTMVLNFESEKNKWLHTSYPHNFGKHQGQGKLRGRSQLWEQM